MANTKNSNLLIYTIIIAMASLLATSCRKAPINGDLDGQWQIMSIENPLPLPAPDLTRKYFTVNLHVFQCWSIDYPIAMSANMIYDKEKKTLLLDFADYNKDPEPEDLNSVKIYEPYRLRAFGIYAQKVKFEIKTLSSKSLVLINPESGTTITCRKF